MVFSYGLKNNINGTKFIFISIRKAFHQNAQDFPNLCFHRQLVHKCSTCDKLDCHINNHIDPSQFAKVQLAIQYKETKKVR